MMSPLKGAPINDIQRQITNNSLGSNKYRLHR